MGATQAIPAELQQYQAQPVPDELAKYAVSGGQPAGYDKSKGLFGNMNAAAKSPEMQERAGTEGNPIVHPIQAAQDYLDDLKAHPISTIGRTALNVLPIAGALAGGDTFEAPEAAELPEAFQPVRPAATPPPGTADNPFKVAGPETFHELPPLKIEEAAALPEAFQPAKPSIAPPPGTVDNPFKAPAPPREIPSLPEAFQPVRPAATPPPGTADNPFKVAGPETFHELPPLKIASPEVTPKAVGQQLEKSLGAGSTDEPIMPIPEGHTPIHDSSLVRSYRYDPETHEMEITLKSNPKKVYVTGEVSQDQADEFMGAKSKGQAYNKLKQSSSPPVARIVNGQRQPVRPLIAQPTGEENVRVLRPDEDLTSILKQSKAALSKKPVISQ